MTCFCLIIKWQCEVIKCSSIYFYHFIYSRKLQCDEINERLATAIPLRFSAGRNVAGLGEREAK